MTFDEACAACAARTGMTPADWADFLACTPEQQSAVATTYRDLAWAKDKDTVGDVLKILGVAAQIAGYATGIGGAIAVLKTLL